MQVTKLGRALGAEIAGIDLSRELPAAKFADIVAAFHEHEVVVFRDQRLTPEQHIAFGRRFGEIDVNVRSRFHKPGYPELLVVSNIVENGKSVGVTDAGRYWHSDHCYLEAPSRCSLLYAHEVPVRDGITLGDTQFASATAAYDALPAEIKRRLEGLRAVNSYSYTYERKVREFDRTPLAKEAREAPPDVTHPVVRTHPYTGRRCLFVNEGYTTRIEGLPREESDRMLAFLLEHAVRADFVYRHSWRVGDLLLWDNCAVQHKAVFDYPPLRRRMERITIRGGRPF